MPKEIASDRSEKPEKAFLDTDLQPANDIYAYAKAFKM